MTDPATLNALAAEVEALDGPRYEVERRVAEALELPDIPPLTVKIDAAMHAFWSALPRHGITTTINPWENVGVEIRQRDGRVVATGHAQHAPMAIVAAVLRGVAARGEG